MLLMKLISLLPIAYLHLSFSNTLSMSLKISQIHIKGFWEGRGEEELKLPFNSTFHKLRTLPNFTIAAINITTEKAPLPVFVGQESRSSRRERTLPACPPLHAESSQLASDYMDWKTP